MGEIRSETSMEDILASIKKIIAEDSDTRLSPVRPRNFAPQRDEMRGSAEVPEAELADSEEILDLSEANVMPVEAVTVPAVEAEIAVEAAPAAAIVSPDAAHASRAALDSLSTMLIKPSSPQTGTLEGLVTEMLRPMLKDWLDSNLPGIVEALVAREISRISGR